MQYYRTQKKKNPLYNNKNEMFASTNDRNDERVPQNEFFKQS